ncbi:hypothetical protein GCM10007940_37020 [Portibacter lacus]|uniref:Uncharacterized protein n=1 Tax=Portibacter lacus TaxID=1099794 RepID=A0AA37SUJ6_9BACT|nr:hypothetical protein GCM10007940_37020 [Portibacter lacus]
MNRKNVAENSDFIVNVICVYDECKLRIRFQSFIDTNRRLTEIKRFLGDCLSIFDTELAASTAK